MLPCLQKIVPVACLLLSGGTGLRSEPVTGAAALNDRSARIVAINGTKPELKISFQGKLYDFPLRVPLLDTRTSRPVSLAQLSVGDRITFVAQPLHDRRLEIVSIVILLDDDNEVVGKHSAAHGSGKPGGDLSGNPGGALALPLTEPVSPFE